MEKEFVPYQLALELKELGFNEPCFGCYEEIEQRDYKVVLEVTKFICLNTLNGISNYNQDGRVSCPTFSQAFRWFREKHNLMGSICEEVDGKFILWTNGGNLLLRGIEYKELNTYEEAEFVCLKKLIEIVKKGE